DIADFRLAGHRRRCRFLAFLPVAEGAVSQQAERGRPAIGDQATRHPAALLAADQHGQQAAGGELLSAAHAAEAASGKLTQTAKIKTLTACPFTIPTARVERATAGIAAEELVEQGFRIEHGWDRLLVCGTCHIAMQQRGGKPARSSLFVLS